MSDNSTILSKILIDGLSTIPSSQLFINNPKIYQVVADNIVENIKNVLPTPFGVEINKLSNDQQQTLLVQSVGRTLGIFLVINSSIINTSTDEFVAKTFPLIMQGMEDMKENRPLNTAVHTALHTNMPTHTSINQTLAHRRKDNHNIRIFIFFILLLIVATGAYLYIKNSSKKPYSKIKLNFF
jgi:hypothetical protein